MVNKMRASENPEQRLVGLVSSSPHKFTATLMGSDTPSWPSLLVK